MSTRERASRTADTVSDSKALTIGARFGFAASGLIHLLLGYLAIRVAFNHQESSDQSGALAALSDLPGGAIVLWVTTIGLFALGLFLVVEAIVGVGSSSKKRWVRSLVSVAKAVAYIALAVTALTFALGGSSSSSGSTSQASGTVLSLPGGVFILAIIGLIAAGVGCYFVYKGVTRGFTDDLTVPSGSARRPVIALGVAGYVAKGIAIVVVGVLFVVAAVKVDPEEATGLDGALQALAELPFGKVVLTAVGLGLIAYGVYSFVRARYARL